MDTTPSATIRERLGWSITTEQYERIRRLWVRHSIAEDRRDIPGLLATLAPSCAYEIQPTGERWEGHPGATTFYETLFAAFPDVHFDLQEIVIGPQGVIEVVALRGTHSGPWAGIPATGRAVSFIAIIQFPWNPAAQLFDGERVWFDRGALGVPLPEPGTREGTLSSPGSGG
ncbi:MAG: ester cyclase [Ktedonobacterales bacterium]|nr:ester cyclase [Ktedonobacterales bacterium]